MSPPTPTYTDREPVARGSHQNSLLLKSSVQVNREGGKDDTGVFQKPTGLLESRTISRGSENTYQFKRSVKLG